MDPLSPKIANNFLKVVSLGIHLCPTIFVFCQPHSWKRAIDKIAAISAILLLLISLVSNDYKDGFFFFDAPVL
jgi:hypothetical protein